MAFDAPRQALLDASRLLAWNQSRTKENEMDQSAPQSPPKLSRVPPASSLLPSLIDLGKNNNDPDPFLQALFDGLIYDGFQFPTKGNNGCIGSNCISKMRVVIVPNKDKKKQIGIHLNFMCKPGGYDGSRLNLEIAQFHLTARPLTTQSLINVAGPSIDTASKSIHINRNTDWGRDDNLKKMASELDLSPDALRQLLLRREGYSKTYMRLAAQAMKQAITTRVGLNGGPTTITWDGSDATFS
jgi:hypothetical protein